MGAKVRKRSSGSSKMHIGAQGAPACICMQRGGLYILLHCSGGVCGPLAPCIVVSSRVCYLCSKLLFTTYERN